MKGWLCLNPVLLSLFGQRMTLPPEAHALLAVYRTKKAARAIHGPKAALMEITIGDIPVKGKKP